MSWRRKLADAAERVVLGKSEWERQEFEKKRREDADKQQRGNGEDKR